MISNYIKVALRYFVRHKSYTAIDVLGLDRNLLLLSLNQIKRYKPNDTTTTYLQMV